MTAIPTALRDRLGTLRNLPRLFRLVWRASPRLALLTVALRLARALLPTAALYVGKLIIDAVVAEARLPHPGPGSATGSRRGGSPTWARSCSPRRRSASCPTCSAAPRRSSATCSASATATAPAST